MIARHLMRRIASALVAPALLLGAAPGVAQIPPPRPAAVPSHPLSYADLASFADAAELVLRVQIRSQAQVEAARAPGLRPERARLFVEAEVLAPLAGPVVPAGAKLRYLVDVPRGVKGKPPKLKGAQMVLFARRVAGRPDELQLVGPDAQLPADAALEDRIRPILDEFFSVDAPPRITGVRDVLWVPGNLAGESETQLFLTTSGAAPALVTVIRRPGMAPAWGVSWDELVDQAVRPPARDTLVWYRLACFLPSRLPAAAHLAADAAARAEAERDYQFVRRALGPCGRTTP